MLKITIEAAMPHTRAFGLPFNIFQLATASGTIQTAQTRPLNTTPTIITRSFFALIGVRVG